MLPFVIFLANNISFFEWIVYIAWMRRLSKFSFWMATKNFRWPTSGRLRPWYACTNFNLFYGSILTHKKRTLVKIDN